METINLGEKTKPDRDVDLVKAEFEELKRTMFKRLHHYPPLSFGCEYSGDPDIRTLWGREDGEGTLYLHIPFCVTRCKYCPFFTSAGSQKQDVDDYLELLIKEIDMYKEVAGHLKFTSLYFGGGTPTYMNEEQFGRIYEYVAKNFSIEGADITVEANPLTITDRKLRFLKSLGVTRISVGIQTFNENVLKIVDRYIPMETMSRTLELVKGVGFEDFNVDLMYGLPEQTLEIWQEDIEKFIANGIKSLTIYRTGYFPHALKEFTMKGYRLPDDDDVDRMYRYAFKRLNEAGFRQPHIGSTFFMRSGINRNRENILLSKPTLALGVSAYSASAHYQYQNIVNMDAYRQKVLNNEPAIGEIVGISNGDRLRKYVIEATKLGYMDKEVFKTIFGISISDVFGMELMALKEMGLIEENGKDISFTFEGVRYIKEIRYLFVDKEKKKQLVITGRPINNRKGELP